MFEARERVGAHVLYARDCSTMLVGPDSHDWDAVLVVGYPSRTAFREMAEDPGYQAILPLRSEGLEAAVLEATRLGAPVRISPGPARA